MRFEEVLPLLSTKTLECISELGYTDMTPVQEATIPLFLTGKDVCVDACTGSGKTVAFVVPMVELLIAKMNETLISSSTKCKLRGLIISPTRELAIQIYKCALLFFNRVHGSNVALFSMVGGTSVEDDLNEILSARGKSCVLVGTPGRLGDILTRSIGSDIDIQDFEMLILDEADSLLDMGFQKTISNILNFLPKQRRTGLFSATQTKEVKALARAGLRNPATISVQVSSKTHQKTPSTLNNYYTFMEVDKKLPFLVSKLQCHKGEKLIVFFSTCACVDFFYSILSQLPLLQSLNLRFISLHGKMTQKKRTFYYQEFLSAKSGILLCTDVVARGIDIPSVDWIFQFDPPQDPSFFIHRVGRTARAGKSGNALIFLCPHEDTYVNFLALKKVPLNELSLPLINETNEEKCHKEVKELVISDRDILEKGTKAFISYIRSYKEHQCEFIFEFKKLDLSKVARSFALLQLPRLTELKKLDIKLEKPPIPLGEIKFKNKAREKQRIEKFIEMKEKLKTEKREKNIKKKEQEDLPRRREKKKGTRQRIEEEWDELAIEERLYRKRKKGKISQEEYEQHLDGNMDVEEEIVQVKKAKQNKFVKRQQTTQKNREQKEQASKREERIKKKKRALHLIAKRKKENKRIR